MDEQGQANNGGRVLSEWRLKNLEDDVKEILAIQGDILHRLDSLPCNERNTRLKIVERDVDGLKKESRWWNGINSVAVAVAAALGIQLRP